MDGLSAAASAFSIAQIAWKVGFEIYDFVQNTLNVNETVRSLSSEVQQLGDICSAVSEQIKLLPSLGPGDAQLLSGVETQLAECLKTINRLDRALDGVRQEKNSFVKQAVRQTKLELTQSGIQDCRSHIHASITNLQLSLQLLSLKATYLAPQVANEKLLDKLTELQNSVDSQRQKLDETLVQCAGNYLSQGTTLYAQSVAPASVLGALPDGKRTAISDWVTKLEALRLDASATDTTTSDTYGSEHAFSAWNQSDGPMSPAAESTSAFGTRSIVPVHDDIDDDDELAAEIADAAISAGTEAFTRNDFQEAESMLQEGLTLMESLPERQRPSLEYLEHLHFLLAVCSYNIHDLPTAEAALVTVVERQSVSDQDALSKCEAGSLLAQVYIRQDKLDLARSTCENVYRGRRKLLKKDNELCYVSLALLVRTYILLGNTNRANTYRSMLPADKRDHYCGMFQSLGSANRLRPPLQAMESSPSGSSAPFAKVESRRSTISSPQASPYPQSIPHCIYPGWSDVTCITCSPDNSELICGIKGPDGTAIEFRDIVTGECKIKLSATNVATPEILAISPDSTKVASYHFSTSLIRIWSVPRGSVICDLSWKNGDGCPTAMEFSPQGDYLAAIWPYRGCRIWQIETGIKIFHEELKYPQQLKFHPVYPSVDVVGIDVKYRISTARFKVTERKYSLSESYYTWGNNGTIAGVHCGLAHIRVYDDNMKDLSRIHLGRDDLDAHYMGPVLAMGYLPDGITPTGTLTVFALSKGVLAMCDTVNRRWFEFDKLLLGTADTHLRASTVDVELSPDCSVLVVEYHNGTFGVWNVALALRQLRELHGCD